jgi:fluoride exporter
MASFTTVILIACGGAGGAVARHLLAGSVQRAAGGSYPWGTLAVNLSGAFAVGVALSGPDSAAFQALALTGFLGSFTTFSTLAFDCSALARRGEGARAALYLGVTMAGGIGMLTLGLALGAGQTAGAGS